MEEDKIKLSLKSISMLIKIRVCLITETAKRTARSKNQLL
jgi:hypothetical protein